MLSFKDAKESSSSSLHETASTAIGAAITASGSSGKHNINDSSANIEEVEKASSNDGNNDGMADEVVVSEAKRRRKSPPVQIRQKADAQMPEDGSGGGIFSPQRPPSSSMSEPSCEEPPPKRLSLKSPLDLEARSDRGAMSSPSPRPKQSESEMANSIQAALTALQAGQVSLNQVHDGCHFSPLPLLFPTTNKTNEVCNFTEMKELRTFLDIKLD